MISEALFQNQPHEVLPSSLPVSGTKVHSVNLKQSKRQARSQGKFRDSEPDHVGEPGKRKVGPGGAGYQPSDHFAGDERGQKRRSHGGDIVLEPSMGVAAADGQPCRSL